LFDRVLQYLSGWFKTTRHHHAGGGGDILHPQTNLGAGVWGPLWDYAVCGGPFTVWTF